MSHWFEYFPGHHMWSQGMLFGIEMQTWGAAALGEIDQVGQKLKGHVGDNEKWWVEWTTMARRIEGFGEAAERAGRQLTAGSYYLRAAVYYFCGERFIAPRGANGIPIAIACAAFARASNAATRISSGSRCPTCTMSRARHCPPGCSRPT